MAQRILNVRVRPPRVAVLLNKDADQADVILAITFFSRLWGGRYHQLLAVDPTACDPLTEFRLGESRPEFVYGVGVDDAHWGDVVRRTCQARRYCPLQQIFSGNFRQPRYENFVTADFPLIRLFQDRSQLPGQNRTLRLISSEGLSPWPALCAAMFGAHSPNLRSEYRDELTTFTADSAGAFVELATAFVTENQQSWLDITSHALEPHLYGSGPLSPTVVLVGSLALDLPLFWNNRTKSDAHSPAWIIPIPAGSVDDPGLIDRLRAWLLAFLPYGPEPNYCKVASQSVPEAVCEEFARRFQAALTDTPIKHVDYEPPANRLPQVIPFEYETTWPVELRGRKLTIIPPKPRAFTELGSRAWVVDLLKDIKTGRAVKEVHPPPTPVAFELLNGACPPHFASFATTIVPRVGDGSVSVNLYCSESKDVVTQCLPSSRELLEETLREHGYNPVADEKRSGYLPVIRRFGGVYLAAKAFSGQSGTVLAALEGEKPLTINEIQSKGQLGKGDLTGTTYLEQIDHFFTGESDRTKRVGLQRFARYSRRESPESTNLRSLLDFWTDRSVLVRHWKVGPCRRCNKVSFVTRLDLQRRVLCPGCGLRVHLPGQVPVGYALHRSVRQAIGEGITPVVMTGRFLRSMTRRGFQWLPGVKYTHAGGPGDIDLVACCDGHLVFCECKRLNQLPADAKVWGEVTEQFLKTVGVAVDCHANLAVLACLGTTCPDAVKQQIETRVGGRIPCLFLDQADLERGHRKTDTHGSRLGFDHLVPRPFPESPRPTQGGPRTINMGWGQYTTG